MADFSQRHNNYSFFSAPSAAPTSVSVSEVTSTSITIHWGTVDCIHRNGDITGYSVRYGVQGSGEGDRTVEITSGDSNGGTYQISGLQSSTNYSIEVAAMNSFSTGVYSTDMFQLTQRMHIPNYIIMSYLTHPMLFRYTVETPILSVKSTSATVISFFWTSAGSVVDSYEVMWQRDTSGNCPDENEGNTTLTDGSTSYNIAGLEEDSNYIVTVIATNEVWNSINNNITVTTREDGIATYIL